MAYFIHFVSNPLSIIIDTIKYQLSHLINSIRNQRFIKYDLLIEMIWLFENAWVLILFIKMFSENGSSQNMNSKFWLIYEWKLLSLVRDISNHLLNMKILFYKTIESMAKTSYGTPHSANRKPGEIILHLLCSFIIWLLPLNY